MFFGICWVMVVFDNLSNDEVRASASFKVKVIQGNDIADIFYQDGIYHLDEDLDVIKRAFSVSQKNNPSKSKSLEKISCEIEGWLRNFDKKISKRMPPCMFKSGIE